MTTATATAEVATMGQKALRTACKAAGISGYGNMTVDAMRAALAAPAKGESLAKTTEPNKKGQEARTVLVAKGSRINKHHNDDGSITLYAQGIKIFRTASDQDMEDGLVSEDYDADAEVDKFVARWFAKGSTPVFGKTTYGHNWKSKKAATAA
jgi:hypothetical protein